MDSVGNSPSEVSSSAGKRKRSVAAGGPRTKIDYPRKRVSIACDICRSRKTRCDASRPCCSFCRDIGAECTYRKANSDPSRPKQNGDPMSKIMERLERMESLISGAGKAASQTHAHEDLQEETDWDFPSHNEGLAIDQFVPGPTPESRSSHSELPDSVPRPLSLTERRPSTYLSPETHRISLPNLEKWSCLLPLNQIEYNEGELYFQTEIRQGGRLYGFTPSKAPDTSPRICLKLQRLFVTNVLPWIPLFDADYCHQLVASASSNRFQNRNVSLALVMFVFALGAISNDDLNTGDSPEDFAGIEYFVQGYKIIDSNRAECNTITVVQCRILWAMYLLHCVRPLQAWNVINEAMRDAIVLCHLKTRMESDRLLGEMARRAYWACYILEYELRGQIGFHDRELHQIHGTMDLPSSEIEEPGFFYFLSEIALRQLLANVLDNIGFSAGQTRYAPVLSFELCSQLSQWYANLPPALSFSLDLSSVPTITLDPQKAFLKAQYYSILCITKWPFIVRFVAQHPDFRGEQELLVREGRDCLESAMRYIDTIEGLLNFRHMLVFPNFIGLHCQTMLLLATYQVPQLREIQMPEHGPAIRKGLAIMRIWEASPSVSNAVRRIMRVMERVGLAPEQEGQSPAPEHTSNDFRDNYEENWNPYGTSNEQY